MLRNMTCWQARSIELLLRYVAESPEDRAVHRRGIVKRVLLLLDILLPCFVVLSVLLSTVICYSSYSSSSFWASCGAGGVDGGGVDGCCGAKYCCITEWTILTKSWTCCSEKLGTDESAPGILDGSNNLLKESIWW